jgi:phage terminase large subunit-like protein
MRVGLVEACDDRELFAVDLWPRQREILAEVERPDKRLFVFSQGRRSGKTFLSALILLWLCLLRDDLAEYVRQGELRFAVGVATNQRQARLLVQAARSVVERSPLLAPMLESTTEDELRFSNGTVLAAFPCSSRGIRGWAVMGALLDEAAHFMSETEGPQVADRVFEALVPATAQFGAEARVILASTPYGVDGLFARVYEQAESGELADAVALKATTAEMNPTVTEELLQAEQARDPDGFRAEYLAEFVGSGSAYLDPARVDAAVAEGHEKPPGELVDVVGGFDPAFSHDPAGLVLVGRERYGPQGKLIVALARAWAPERGASFEERREREDRVLEEVAKVCRAYEAGRVYTDQYAASAVVHRLQAAGVYVESVAMSATSKTLAYAELRAKLYAGDLELYENPTLIAELKRLRSKFSAGAAAVVNPRVGGSHGDLAQALALAVWQGGEASAGLAYSLPTEPVPPGAVAGTDAWGW